MRYGMASRRGNGSLPPPGLVDTLGDEVGGEGVLELAAVLEGVVHLGVGHATALEPAVEDLQHPAELALPTAGRDGQVVDAEGRRAEERQATAGLWWSWAARGPTQSSTRKHTLKLAAKNDHDYSFFPPPTGLVPPCSHFHTETL